jgi:hypothetical protein
MAISSGEDGRGIVAERQANSESETSSSPDAHPSPDYFRCIDNGTESGKKSHERMGDTTPDFRKCVHTRICQKTGGSGVKTLLGRMSTELDLPGFTQKPASHLF